MSLSLDGKVALRLLRETVIREGLRVGQELSSGQLEQLTTADQSVGCYSAALRYLGYRPRSESEVRERLRRRGFGAACVESTVERLRAEGLLGDREFAEFWRDNRQLFRPRSRRLTGVELRRKGVSRDVIEQVMQGVDDTESAYRAAVPRVRLLRGLPYETWRRKLGDYLRRRGFSYEVADSTIKRLWGEATGEQARRR